MSLSSWRFLAGGGDSDRLGERGRLDLLCPWEVEIDCRRGAEVDVAEAEVEADFFILGTLL